MPKTIPFLMEAVLDSPVILSPDAYLTLDSLLAASYQLRGEDDANLPLKRTADVYHASAGILVGNPITSEAPFVARLTVRDCSNQRIKPNRKSGLIISTVSFPDKARLDRYTAFHAAKVIWFGYGDPEETLRILSRLPGVGKRCHSGYGQVSAYSVTPIQRDFSMQLPDDTLARPVPTGICQQLGIDLSHTHLDRATYKPNYFDFSHADLCAMPTTRLINKEDVDFLKVAA
jgi:hypothetical protein